MDYVNEIKEKLNITDIVGGYVQLKNTGKNLKGLCPFHKEKTPSFIVSEDIQRYKCFGCGKTGDIFNFIMEMEGVNFAESAKILAYKAGVKIDVKDFDKDKNIRINKLYEANRIASLFYQKVLLKTDVGKGPLKYILSRKIGKDSILEYKLGYSPNNWSSLSDFLIKKGFSADILIDAGLSKRGPKGLYDVYRNRLMIPLIDQFNKVVGFSGRSLDDTLPKYVNTQDTEVFHKQNYLYGLNLTKSYIREAGYVVIVEGFFDVISPYAKGIKNVLATSGTALTSNQIKLIKRFTDTLVFMFDNDSAGLTASLRALESLPLNDLNIKVAILDKKYKDPDEAAIKEIDSLENSIKNALPIWDFYFHYAQKAFNMEDVFTRKKAASFVASRLKAISDPLVKNEYYKKFAMFFETDINVAKESVDRAVISSNDKKFPNDEKKAENTVKNQNDYKARINYEIYYLALIFSLEYGKIVDYTKHFDSESIKDPSIKELYIDLREYLKDNKKFNKKDFYDKILENKPHLRGLLDQVVLFNFDSEVLLEDEEKLKAEITNIALRLKTEYTKTKLIAIAREISKAESVGDTKKLTQLLNEVRNLQEQKF